MNKNEKSEGQKRYDKFMEHVKKAYSGSLKKEDVFRKRQALWKDVKNDSSKYQKVVNDLISIEQKSLKKKRKRTPRTFNHQKSTTTNQQPQATPAQEKLKKSIEQLEVQVALFIQVKDTRMSTVSKKQIEDKKDELQSKKNQLKRLKSDAARKQKFRLRFCETLNEACKENPNLTERFKFFTRAEGGRSGLEKGQQGILAAIVKIVQATSDERGRIECLRTVTTLIDLTTELRKMGFKLNRSATYLK